MTHRIDSCHLLNQQYDRTESLQRKEDSFHAINRQHANPLPLTEQGCPGSDTTNGDVFGLKPIHHIFSSWDSSLWQETFQGGMKDSIRNQYLHPWWTRYEDSSSISFGSTVSTSVVAFSVNAAFEGLSRLTYSSFTLAERALEHDDKITICQADLLKLKKSYTGASKATRDIQAQLTLHDVAIQAGQKAQEEAKKLQRDQADAFLHKFETWVVRDVIDKKFSTLSMQYAKISAEHAASEEKRAADLERVQCLEQEIEKTKKENENLRLRLEKVEMILGVGPGDTSAQERQDRDDISLNAGRKQSRV